MNPLSPYAPRLTWLVVAFVTAFCALMATVGADAHWLAALGGWVVKLGDIPPGVPYAAAPSDGWSNVPILGELVFHALQAGLGDRGLVLALVGATALALGFIAFDMRRDDVADAPSALALLLVAVAAASSILLVRGQVFSLALFPVLVYVLRSQARSPGEGIWLVVPLFALWSNLHGGVLIGVAVAGSYLLFNRLSRTPLETLGVLAASIAALFLTPALLNTGAYYHGVLGSEAASSREGLWAPISFGSPLDLAFLAVAIPFLVAALLSRPRLWELVAIAGLVALTAQSVRSGVWLVIFLATPAARWLTGSREWRVRLPAKLTGVVAAIFLCLIALGLFRTPTPSGAGVALRAKAARAAHGRPILADDLDAEALAVDGREVWIANPLDAFPKPDQRHYLDWVAGRASGDVLLRLFPVALVTRDSAAARRLGHTAGWKAVAHDERAVLFVKHAR